MKAAIADTGKNVHGRGSIKLYLQRTMQWCQLGPQDRLPTHPLDSCDQVDGDGGRAGLGAAIFLKIFYYFISL